MQSCADTEKEKTEQIILTADKITNTISDEDSCSACLI